MLQKRPHIISLIVLGFVLVTQLASGAFSGSAGDKDNKDNNKFSLKNLNKISKNYSLFSLHTNVQFKGYKDLTEQKTETGLQVNSFMRMEKGNTTFVYPYKYKVRTPKFKTPAPPNQ